MSAPIQVVPTGVANLEAVTAAFRRLGRTVRLVNDATRIAEAAYVVLPGVGSFDRGVAALAERGWEHAIAERVGSGRPTLAICLGFQLLCEASDEAPGRRGLGVVPGRLARFGTDVRVPQLGWNRVQAPPCATFLRTGLAYFANSYRLAAPPPGWTASTGRYGGPFVAAVERAGVLACQFHPELSGAFGLRLLDRWLALAPVAGPECGGPPTAGRGDRPPASPAAASARGVPRPAGERPC